MAEAAGEPAPGRVEMAALRDLQAMGAAAQQSTLGELVLVLARAIDTRGDGSPSITAKLVAELRVTLGQLREVTRDGDGGEDPAELSTPVWDRDAAVRDAAVAGAADVGAEGSGDRPPAG